MSIIQTYTHTTIEPHEHESKFFNVKTFSLFLAGWHPGKKYQRRPKQKYIFETIYVAYGEFDKLYLA